MSAYSDYPPEAKRLPRVADANGPLLETLAALHPDLVLAWKDSIRPEEVERLAHLVPAVFVAQARTLEDVPRLLAAIGALAGVDTGAASRAYDARLAQLRRTYAGRRAVPVFLEIWERPLTTISGRHFMNEALATCGARNVFAALPGVESIAFSRSVPFGGFNFGQRFIVEGQPDPKPGAERTREVNGVSPAFFNTMDLPLIAGRGCWLTTTRD